MKYCFAHDDDGHNYLIPLSLKERFYHDMEKAYGLDDFSIVDWVDEYRCGSVTGYSFENPEAIGRKIVNLIPKEKIEALKKSMEAINKKQ